MRFLHQQMNVYFHAGWNQLESDRIRSGGEDAIAAQPAGGRPGWTGASHDCAMTTGDVALGVSPETRPAGADQRDSPSRGSTPQADRCSGVTTKSSGKASTPCNAAMSNSTPWRKMGAIVSTEYSFTPVP